MLHPKKVIFPSTTGHRPFPLRLLTVVAWTSSRFPVVSEVSDSRARPAQESAKAETDTMCLALVLTMLNGLSIPKLTKGKRVGGGKSATESGLLTLHDPWRPKDPFGATSCGA